MLAVRRLLATMSSAGRPLLALTRPSGEMAARKSEGLRKAGIPEALPHAPLSRDLAADIEDPLPARGVNGDADRGRAVRHPLEPVRVMSTNVPKGQGTNPLSRDDARRGRDI